MKEGREMRRDKHKKIMNTFAVLLLLSTFALSVFVNGTYFVDWMKQNSNYQYVQDQMILTVQLDNEDRFDELQVKAQILKGNRTKSESYLKNSALWSSILMVSSSFLFSTYWVAYGRGDRKRQFIRPEDLPFNYEDKDEFQDRPGVQ